MSARGKTNKQLPPANGKLVRKTAICNRCDLPCVVGGQVIHADGYYVFNDEKLCKLCIKKIGVI